MLWECYSIAINVRSSPPCSGQWRHFAVLHRDGTGIGGSPQAVLARWRQQERGSYVYDKCILFLWRHDKQTDRLRSQTDYGQTKLLLGYQMHHIVYLLCVLPCAWYYIWRMYLCLFQEIAGELCVYFHLCCTNVPCAVYSSVYVNFAGIATAERVGCNRHCSIVM